MGMSNASQATPVATTRDRCAVCGGAMPCLVELPGLPLTDTFTNDTGKFDQGAGVFDQWFMYCETCTHGQLGTIVPGDLLYGHAYGFRTSVSPTARRGCEFFLGLIDKVAGDRRYRSVLDVGCNDLYLLECLAEWADARTGVDPVWAGQEISSDDPTLTVLGRGIEELDAGDLPEAPDLIVCRHTLEHVADPAEVLRKLAALAAPDVLFVFEVPSLDGLLTRLRFDQIFHQHLHYFSKRSLRKLFSDAGFACIGDDGNYHDWGAIAMAFTREGSGTHESNETMTWQLSAIGERYDLFRQQMTAAQRSMELLSVGPRYGYGAAQMLPVIGYHMGTDFAYLDAILDDDAAKDGSGYTNLPVRIRKPDGETRLDRSSVLITAFDNVQPIMNRLMSERPRHVVVPLAVI